MTLPLSHAPSRRRALATAVRLTLTVTAMLCLIGTARAAEDFPNRPLRLITPFVAGASTDRLARVVAEGLSKSLGQPVVVESKAGAGGNLAAEATAKAPKDGHTLMLVSAGIVTMNPHIYRKLPFDPQKDLAPLTIGARMAMVVMANPQQPFRTPRELLDYARANPGKLTYGSAGVGTSQHLAGELFKRMAKVDIVHVPYKGGAPAMTDLIGGQVALMFGQAPSAAPQVKAGKVRALAMGSPTRSGQFPDVPTLDETVLPGYDADTWYGFMTTAGTPAPVMARLQAAIVAALKDNAARLAEDGYAVVATGPGPMAQAIQAESLKWGEVIRAAHIQPE